VSIKRRALSIAPPWPLISFATMPRATGQRISWAILIACLLTGSTRTFGDQQSDWHKDPSRAAEVGIDTDLSKEQPTLALPPEGGDTDWPYYNNRIDGDRYL
jgi:hypothetical protein